LRGLNLRVGEACVSEPASEFNSGAAPRGRREPEEQRKRITDQVGLRIIGVRLADLPYGHRARRADRLSHTSQQFHDLLRREVVQDVAEEYNIVIRAQVVNEGITCPVGHDIIETLGAGELLSLLDRLWKVKNLRPHWRMSACDQCAVQAVGTRNVQQSLCAGVTASRHKSSTGLSTRVDHQASVPGECTPGEEIQGGMSWPSSNRVGTDPANPAPLPHTRVLTALAQQPMHKHAVSQGPNYIRRESPEPGEYAGIEYADLPLKNPPHIPYRVVLQSLSVLSLRYRQLPPLRH
jgi:hypothetical protein